MPFSLRPSVPTSMYFVAKDAAVVAALYAAVVWAESRPDLLPEVLVKYLVYPVYWFLQVIKARLSDSAASSYVQLYLTCSGHHVLGCVRLGP